MYCFSKPTPTAVAALLLASSIKWVESTTPATDPAFPQYYGPEMSLSNFTAATVVPALPTLMGKKETNDGTIKNVCKNVRIPYLATGLKEFVEEAMKVRNQDLCQGFVTYKCARTYLALVHSSHKGTEGNNCLKKIKWGEIKMTPTETADLKSTFGDFASDMPDVFGKILGSTEDSCNKLNLNEVLLDPKKTPPQIKSTCMAELDASAAPTMTSDLSTAVGNLPKDAFSKMRKPLHEGFTKLLTRDHVENWGKEIHADDRCANLQVEHLSAKAASALSSVCYRNYLRTKYLASATGSGGPALELLPEVVKKMNPDVLSSLREELSVIHPNTYKSVTEAQWHKMQPDDCGDIPELTDDTKFLYKVDAKCFSQLKPKNQSKLLFGKGYKLPLDVLKFTTSDHVEKWATSNDSGVKTLNEPSIKPYLPLLSSGVHISSHACTLFTSKDDLMSDSFKNFRQNPPHGCLAATPWVTTELPEDTKTQASLGEAWFAGLPLHLIRQLKGVDYLKTASASFVTTMMAAPGFCEQLDHPTYLELQDRIAPNMTEDCGLKLRFKKELKENDWGAINANALRLYTDKEVAEFDVSTLPTTHLATLGAGADASHSPGLAFSSEVVGKLSPEKFAALPPHIMSAIPAGSFASLTAEHIKLLKPEQLTDWKADRVRALTDDAFKALSDKQFEKLGSAIDSTSPDHPSHGITDERLGLLSGSAHKACLTHVMKKGANLATAANSLMVASLMAVLVFGWSM